MRNEDSASGERSPELSASGYGAPALRRWLLVVAAGVLVLVCVVVGYVWLAGVFATEVEKVLLRASVAEQQVVVEREARDAAPAASAWRWRATTPGQAKVVRAWMSLRKPANVAEHMFSLGTGVLITRDDGPPEVGELLDRFSPGTEPLHAVTVASYRAWRRTLRRPEETLTRTKHGNLLIRPGPTPRCYEGPRFSSVRTHTNWRR